MRIWHLDPPESSSKRDWTGEVVGEFCKGGARVAMVEVSLTSVHCLLWRQFVSGIGLIIVERYGHDIDHER